MTQSIRTRIIPPVFICVVPALIALVSPGVKYRQQEIKSAHENALRVLYTFGSDQERTLESTRELIPTLSKLPDIRGQRAAGCRELLIECLKENPLYASIFVADKDGVIFVSGVLPFSSHDIRHRKYFQDSRITGNFSVGEYITGVTVGRPVLHFAYPIKEQSEDLGEPGRDMETTLLAEDDGTVRRLIKDVLTRQGYPVIRLTERKRWSNSGSTITQLTSSSPGLARRTCSAGT